MKCSNKRINILLCLLLLIWSVVVGRLFYLQILENEYYQALAQGQHKSGTFLTGNRGEVFFKSGELLAHNEITYHAYTVPSSVLEKEKTAEKLSDILEIEKENILERVNREAAFVYLKKNLTEEEIERLNKANLTGISIENDFTRKYVNEDMASQLIGFLGGENIGQYGIEGYYNDILKPQEAISRWGLAGQLLGLEADQIDGADIYLTIDYNIQFMAESLLEQAYNNYNIESGSIIIMNPKTGAILALANFPNFNPNYYSQETNFQNFQNPTIQKVFEPGSTFKVFTIAAALNENKITPETKYEDRGMIQIGGYTLRNYNHRIFGTVDMTEVLEKSINTGAVFAQREIGGDVFLNYLEKFGFFEKTDIDLYGEIFAQNLEFKQGYDVNFATASYGQGINVTSMQILRAFSALVNDGRMVQPYVVDRVVENKTEIKTSPSFSNQIISSKTANQTTAMMVSTIENGFSKQAKIEGYYLAGKTGTSQIPWSVLGENKRGYSDKTWQTFIGFGPAHDAEFMILVKLDNPATRTAEYSAMPVFRDMANYLINYLRISPEYDI